MTNPFRVALPLSFSFSFAFAVCALAQTTVTLQNGPGYSGTTDAWISCCDAAGMTFGLNNDMELRSEASDSAVIRFAIFQSEGGPVPDGATINSSVLSLYKYDGPDAVFKASRLLKSWDEAQVTWNNTVTSPTSVPWTIAGAQGAGSDYVDGSTEQGSVAASSGCMTSPYPANCWMNIDVTGSVQLFANASAQNFGWKIAQVSSSAEATYKNFVSKDNANFDTLRPKLTVTYSTVQPCNTGTLRPFDQAPVNGNPISIPAGGATFEAENFNCGGQNNAYHDNVAGNAGGVYRTTEDVDITTSTGASGYVVNNFETGEWLTYTVSVQTSGAYDIGILAANHLQPDTTAIFHVEIDNVNVGTISVPNTGSWDVFGWFTDAGVQLSAGTHVLKLYADQQYGNVDALRLLPSTSSGVAECSAPGLQLCVQFEAAPDTTFSGSTVTTQSLGGSILWYAQNAAPDSATDTNRITLVPISREGSSAIKLQTLDNDSNVHSSGDWERSEIELSSADSATAEGTDSWWADSLYIPADSVMPSATETQVNLFQFHGNIGSAPNFALSIINQTGTNPHKVFRAYTAGGSPTGGIDGMGTQYDYVIDGTTHRIGQCISDDVAPGAWYDFVHHIRWSSTGTGSHEIWMRKAGGPVVKVLDRQNISTVYSGDAPYLKIGVYHSPVLGANTSVIHDRLRRGNSADAVRLPDFPVDPTQPVTWCANVTP